MVKVSSTTLSLLPSTGRTGTNSMGSTWRTTQKTNFYTINEMQSASARSKPHTPPEGGVSFMNKRVSTAFNDNRL